MNIILEFFAIVSVFEKFLYLKTKCATPKGSTSGV